ncbi:MAG: four-carbon acid sugar kinase family protein [Lachnospiraceae bacterium]
MVTLLIISDDFTGALDTGVKFARSGASVRVVTDYEYDFAEVARDTQVLVMDAETRHISGDKAYERICQIVKRAKQAGVPYLYKKTDSALRGNIGSELTAVLDASGEKVIHFLPAFPEMGRTTKRGIHYIDGIPVKDSVFGNDPFEPVICSDISRIIRQQSEVDVAVIENGIIFTDPKHPTVAVYDAESDKELWRLARSLAETKQLSVLAGCAGMAETLPLLLGLEGAGPAGFDLNPQLLVACGSVNPITRKQLDYAEAAGFGRMRLTPQQKLEPGYFDTEIGRKKIKELTGEAAAARYSILDTNDEPGGQDTLAYAREHNIDLETVRIRIASVLGLLLKELIAAGLEHTVLITGGDSLLGFMNQVSVCEMIPLCELAPGTVLSQFEINGRDYKVISKSGGFGGEDLLVELAGKITGKEEEMAL